MSTNSIGASISVNPANTAEGTFHLQLKGTSDLQVSIEPRVTNMLPCSISVARSDESTLDVSIWPRYFSTLPASIQPRTQSIIPVSIGVNPYNTMDIISDVYAPPSITLKFPAIKDTFIRESIARLNYGQEESVFVGNLLGSDLVRTLLQFDATSVPDGVSIKRCDLKIYAYNATVPMNIDVFEASNEWEELSATWANQPSAGKYIATLTAAGSSDGVASVSLLPMLEQWKHGANTGIMLKASDESAATYIQMCSKEGTDAAPTLEVEYIDPIVRSYSKSSRPANITVRVVDKSELTTSITVASHNIITNFLASITVPIYPGSTQITADITVKSRSTPNDLSASITVPIYPDETLLPVSIYVRERVFLPVSITVPIYNVTHALPVSIEVRVKASKILPVSITVPKYSLQAALPVSLFVRAREALPASITVPIYAGHSDLPVDIQLRLAGVMPASIQVIRSDYKNLNASVRVRAGVALPVSIQVSSGYIGASIAVPWHMNSDITASITPRMIGISDLVCYIRVGSVGAYAFIM